MLPSVNLRMYCSAETFMLSSCVIHYHKDSLVMHVDDQSVCRVYVLSNETSAFEKRTIRNLSLRAEDLIFKSILQHGVFQFNVD